MYARDCRVKTATASRCDTLSEGRGKLQAIGSARRQSIVGGDMGCLGIISFASTGLILKLSRIFLRFRSG
jgi:hypothetical protein